MSYGKSPPKLDQLTDVNVPSPTDNYVLSWDLATGKWIAVPVSASISDIDFTATENDDEALRISCDAAGFSDIEAIDIAYTTGAMAAGKEESGVLMNIDETLATGGEVFGLEILSTGEGSASIYGLSVGATVNPVEQQSGTFVDADSILVNAVDETTDLSTGGAGGVSIFVADNDTITIGNASTFNEIEIILDTAASGSGIAPTFEYSTGVGTWQTFGPTDGTGGCRNTGVIAWLDADVGSWAVGTGSEYLIRITRTRNIVSTTPIADLIKIADTAEYVWDKDGALSVDTVTTAGDITMNGTGAIAVASGTTAQRPGSPANGMFRYNSTDSAFEGYAGGAWGAIGGGGAIPEAVFGGDAAEHSVNTTTAFAPIEYVDLGTVEVLVRAFDDTTEEYMQGSLRCPADLDTSGTVTFEMHGWSKTAAASKNIAMTFGHRAVADSETMDGTFTDEDADDQAVDSTQDDLDIITWTETVTNLGWAAGDNIHYRFSRFSATTNNLSGDYYVHRFLIRVPRA